MKDLEKLTKLIRYYILKSTTEAGSGHATSSLSAVELTTTLFFKYFHYDLENPQSLANDRFILSKGHASPLLYSLYAAAGAITEEKLWTLRQFDSDLEGHPTPRFRYAEAATGSLGQGLSLGVGMCLALRQQLSRVARQSQSASQRETLFFGQPGLHHRQLPNVYVLLGDGEMAEGQVWEAINLASHYKLNNLVAILDVNRLGQSQQTMLGHAVETYAKRVEAFGWEVEIIEDGHNLEQIDKAYKLQLTTARAKPLIFIAKTVKGKGVSFLEDKNDWHGIALKPDELTKALQELGEVNRTIRGKIQMPNSKFQIKSEVQDPQKFNFAVYYQSDDQVATRKAFGEALVKLGELEPNLVVLDGDVQNSTYTQPFAKRFPERFFQMYIAEQNLVSVAVGMSRLGLRPLVSTFGAFLTRAYDQIRMATLSGVNIIINGSHAGVSIGEDGPSQMGLEDLAMFRSLFDCTILYPCDAVATEKLMQKVYSQRGIIYIRTARPKTPIIYQNEEEFEIGESKKFPASRSQLPVVEKATIVGAGITVIEALKAQAELAKEGIGVNVIDCYSISPIDKETLIQAARKTGLIITVEDHNSVGGLGDAVLQALAEEKNVRVIKLAVTKTPKSGKPDELFDFEGISATEIVKKVKELLK